MKKISFILCTFCFLIISCSNKQSTPQRTDTSTSGIAEIAVDECFAPIIQQQVNVFEAVNQEATILPTYTSELEAFNLFMKDSIRVLIATRELTKGEAQIIKDRKQNLRSIHLAVDGIALIINKSNRDSLITINDIKKIMTGQITSWKDLDPESKYDKISIAFDSPNSSTVRYIKDVICEGAKLGTNLKAMQADSFQTIDLSEKTPNQRVIDYVANNPTALGIIGVSWISNPVDTTTLSFVKGITIMSISRDSVAERKNSFKPYPALFSPGLPVDKQYPLQRNVYIMISDRKGGLPSGFVSFAAGEKGQRIIYKAGLFPATVPTRLVNIKPSF